MIGLLLFLVLSGSSATLPRSEPSLYLAFD